MAVLGFPSCDSVSYTTPNVKGPARQEKGELFPSLHQKPGRAKITQALTLSLASPSVSASGYGRQGRVPRGVDHPLS